MHLADGHAKETKVSSVHCLEMKCTYSHVTEPRQLSDHLIDEFGSERFAVLLKLIRLQSKSQLFFGMSSIDDTELFHEHDPRVTGQKKLKPRFHAILT